MLLDGSERERELYDTEVGPELVTNGDFTGSADGWNLGTGWSYGNNNIVATTPAGAAIQSGVPIIDGRTYRVTYTLSNYVSGSYRFDMYGDETFVAGTPREANGTYTEDLVAGTGGVSGNSNEVRINTPVDGTATIDNVSIREYQASASIASESLADAEKRWLIAAGATLGGTLDDMWREVLTAAGYTTNSLADQKRAFADANYSLFTTY